MWSRGAQEASPLGEQAEELNITAMQTYRGRPIDGHGGHHA